MVNVVTPDRFLSLFISAKDAEALDARLDCQGLVMVLSFGNRGS